MQSIIIALLTLTTTVFGAPKDVETRNLKICTANQYVCGYELLNGQYVYSTNTALQDAMILRGLDPEHRWDSLFWCGNAGTVVAIYDCKTWDNGGCHPPNDFGTTYHCQPGGL